MFCIKLLFLVHILYTFVVLVHVLYTIVVLVNIVYTIVVLSSCNNTVFVVVVFKIKMQYFCTIIWYFFYISAVFSGTNYVCKCNTFYIFLFRSKLCNRCVVFTQSVDIYNYIVSELFIKLKSIVKTLYKSCK